MPTTTYTIPLEPAEERLAQLMTRDAWTYFNNLISQREILHIKDVPMMPRGGMFELPDDLEIAQYYVDMAEPYTEQLCSIYGFDEMTAKSACETFVAKVEVITGVRKGMKGTVMAAV